MMDAFAPILLPVLVGAPFLAALLTPFLPAGKDNGFQHGWAMAVGALLVALAAPLAVLPANVLSFSLPWFPSFGVQFALGTDGISTTLAILTAVIGLLAIIASKRTISTRIKLYYSMLFLLIGSVLGVFLSRDLFLFFAFFELELIPMYLLISIWGGPRRQYAATKFVLYTLFGSVFMLASMFGLYVLGGQFGLDPATLFSFDTLKALTTQGGLALGTSTLLFLGFLIAFAVKLPVVPLHTWLPDAHVEAPTPVSMLLAGILLKMGGYGLLRFCMEWFPDVGVVMAPLLGILAVVNILYTGSIALAQADMKKLIAYSSVSHMGFVLLALATLNTSGFVAAMFVMVAHGLVSAGLFMGVGALYRRTHSRDIALHGGVGQKMPTLFYFFMLLSMASLGLPFLISFAGETLVFYSGAVSQAFSTIQYGLFQLPLSIQGLTILAAFGVVLGAAYSLWLLKRLFFGEVTAPCAKLTDLTLSERVVFSLLAIGVVTFGFFPSLLTDAFKTEAESIAKPYAQRLTATETPIATLHYSPQTAGSHPLPLSTHKGHH